MYRTEYESCSAPLPLYRLRPVVPECPAVVICVVDLETRTIDGTSPFSPVCVYPPFPKLVSSESSDKSRITVLKTGVPGVAHEIPATILPSACVSRPQTVLP